MPVIAPWLETRPADFAQATEAGLRVGAERRAQDLAAAEAGARISSENAQLSGRLQAQLSEQQQQAQLERERIDATSRIAGERNNLAAQIAARKFQAQQAYQQDILNGVDPVKALMTHGPSMGSSMAGLGQLSMSQFRDKQAMIPPNILKDEDGNNLGVYYNGKFSPMGRGRGAGTGAGGVDGAIAPNDMAFVKVLQAQLGKGGDDAAITKQIEGILYPDRKQSATAPATQLFRIIKDGEEGAAPASIPESAPAPSLAPESPGAPLSAPIPESQQSPYFPAASPVAATAPAQASVPESVNAPATAPAEDDTFEKKGALGVVNKAVSNAASSIVQRIKDRSDVGGNVKKALAGIKDLKDHPENVTNVKQNVADSIDHLKKVALAPDKPEEWRMGIQDEIDVLSAWLVGTDPSALKAPPKPGDTKPDDFNPFF